MPDPIVDPNATPPAGTPWFSTFDDATKGHITAKGWDKLEAPAAFAEALKAYKGVETFLGLPAERVLKLPEATDAEGMKGVFQRLGVPADATGYDFSAVKKADGSAPDEAFVGFLREQALKHNLTKDGAAGLAAAIVQRDSTIAAEAAAAHALKVTAEKEALNVAWAGNATLNTFMAQRAAAMIGLDTETLNKVAETVGYQKVMTGFLDMAKKMGEAPLEGGGIPGAGGDKAMTAQQAAARLEDLKAGRDSDWTARYKTGESKAVDELRRLTQIVVLARMTPQASP